MNTYQEEALAKKKSVDNLTEKEKEEAESKPKKKKTQKGFK